MTGSDTARFAGRVLIVIALAASAWLLWQLRDVLLLVFAGVLFSIVLSAATGGIQRIAPMPRWLALTIASILILALLGGAVWLFGQEVTRQLGELLARLPDAWIALQREIGAAGIEDEFREQMGRAMPDSGTVLNAIRFVLGGFGSVLSGVALALLGGVYLAAQPHIYRRGTLLMTPKPRAAQAERAIDATGVSLRAWLLGQLISMSITGIAIAVGLIWIGVPSPLALGLIAGLMGFVPMIGPLLGALPGVLVALTLGTDTLLLTILLYFVVQQLAGSVIEPLIMQHTVKLPPAMTLFALFAIGAIFGPVGVLLGGPLAVVFYVLTRELYVRDALGHEIDNAPSGS
ncbi:AI-2E family transporter [Allosphingosinicella indica]|uniref:Predicted PurR-regulated permease PerM n=1 Tax=Allosphingosinicella indica TaxID=941907 RepID=A0A1X7H042_9SPHN|nr:AI-2E family transporter [Allosphingosinicella indica]SMF77463.1 Predicted PurR-regulated permease PerM [Allosphingosinicella indica]